MPSYTPSSSYPQKRGFNTLLDAARPFLREQLELVDPALPSLISVVRSVGAGECFHKHGSFLSHLTDVYRILKLWCAPDPVARCGLLHSAYSNAYVNLAIFDPGTSRDYVRSLVGAPAERLIHLFCIVPRHTLIHDDLHFRYSDAELVEHLALSEVSLREAKGNGVFNSSEPWRRKLQSLLPAEGITVKHIKTGEDVAVSRRMVAIFLLLTVADFSDQLFDYQDKMFDNDKGRLEFKGNNWTVLWPGTGKPGLWMNLNSKLGALYTLILREEEIYLEERKRGGGGGSEGDRDEEIELVIPPVFDNFTKVLDAQEQIVARDLYWEAICGDWEKEGKWERAEELLLGSCEKNPFVGEPHLVLAQVYMNLERYEEAEREAESGLRLIIEWGSSWDKRMTWEGWVSWGRAMLAKAKEKSWPHAAWGIINLGLVRKKAASSDPNESQGKKDKKSKASSAPKRSPTAIFLFIDEFRKTFKEADPDSKTVYAVLKEGVGKWKSMTDEEKKPYVDREAELKAEYEKEMVKLNEDNEEEACRAILFLLIVLLLFPLISLVRKTASLLVSSFCRMKKKKRSLRRRKKSEEQRILC